MVYELLFTAIYNLFNLKAANVSFFRPVFREEKQRANIGAQIPPDSKPNPPSISSIKISAFASVSAETVVTAITFPAISPTG